MSLRSQLAAKNDEVTGLRAHIRTLESTVSQLRNQLALMAVMATDSRPRILSAHSVCEAADPLGVGAMLGEGSPVSPGASSVTGVSTHPLLLQLHRPSVSSPSMSRGLGSAHGLDGGGAGAGAGGGPIAPQRGPLKSTSAAEVATLMDSDAAPDRGGLQCACIGPQLSLLFNPLQPKPHPSLALDRAVLMLRKVYCRLLCDSCVCTLPLCALGIRCSVPVFVRLRRPGCSLKGEAATSALRVGLVSGDHPGPV